MKIPKKINVLGLTYKVSEQENVCVDSLTALGLCDFAKQKIVLDKNQCQEQKESTLLHEIIEAINNQLELEIPHRVMSALETSIYQVIQDNKLFK
jgi:GTPase Era involved in 16S rRNA processing